MSNQPAAAAAAKPANHLPPPALNRITRELSLLTRDPPPGIAAYAPHPSDISSLRAQIEGPPSTPYADGVFLVTIHVTARYPFEPPRVRFVTPVYHPNIDSAGRICLDTLKSPPAGSWSPAVSLPSLLTTLRTLLGEPNPDDALVAEIAEEYKRRPEKWRRVARDRTEREASLEKLTEVERALDGKKRDAGGGNDDAKDEGGGGRDEEKARGRKDQPGAAVEGNGSRPILASSGPEETKDDIESRERAEEAKHARKRVEGGKGTANEGGDEKRRKIGDATASGDKATAFLEQ